MKDPVTGKENTMDLPVTQEQIDEFSKPGVERRNIQDIFPNLNAEQREFLKTGMTQKSWDSIMRNM